MAQDFEAKQTFPFDVKRNRLFEFLVTDVLAAAGSATLITPAVIIFDRSVTNDDDLIDMIDKI